MKSYFAKRCDVVTPSQINDFFNLLLSNSKATALCVGQPNFRTPDHIANAGIRAIQEGKTFYTGDNGLPELRMAISELMERKYHVSYSSEEILMTFGASEAIDLSLRTFVNPGDEVIVFDPVYDAYVPCILQYGGKPVHVLLDEKDSFKINPEKLKEAITPKTKAIVMNFPNNPTGAIMTEEDLKPIAKICIDHDLLVISDEVYSELTYQGKHTTIASLPGMKERTVLINGFSKAYAMTGWRLGFACAPHSFIEKVRDIHAYTAVCVSSVSQYAALEAILYGDKDIEIMRDDYDKRRRYAYQRILAMGLKCFEPEGAFYLFPNISPTSLDSYTLATRLFYEEELAVIPGTAFGSTGKDYLRISYTCSMDELKLGLDKLEHFLKGIDR